MELKARSLFDLIDINKFPTDHVNKAWLPGFRSIYELERDVIKLLELKNKKKFLAVEQDLTIPQRKCTVCNQSFPATWKYFYKGRNGSLVGQCKKCRYKVARAYVLRTRAERKKCNVQDSNDRDL